MDERIKVYVYPENPDSAGLLERYRENWGLLKNSSEFCPTKLPYKFNFQVNKKRNSLITMQAPVAQMDRVLPSEAKFT